MESDLGITKIRVLHTTLFLKMGGLETVLMDLCRYRNVKKITLEVLCFTDCDPVYRDELEKKDVHVHVIKRNGRFDFSFFRKIIGLLRKKNIDVLHTHSGCIFNSVLCAWFARVPVKIFTEHGLPIYADGTPMPVTFKSKLENWFVGKSVSHMVAVSKEIRDNLQSRYLGCRDKVSLLPNGIDAERFTNDHDPQSVIKVKQDFNISPSQFIIGSVGRLAPVKNYPSLLHAFSILQHENKGVCHLVLVGDGPEMESLQQLARKLRIEQNVTFAGIQYDIQKILPIFDVFVLPSWTEGTSISLLEALSCGIPAVVSNVGGNPDVIKDAECGFLYSVNDSEEMAEEIDTLIINRSLLERMSKKARSHVVGRYDVKTMAEQYEQLYAKLLVDLSHRALN